MKQPIGILGGTFDPVHLGHVGLAEDVYRHCKMSEVRLIPLYTPPHREMPVASPEQRLNMLRLATVNSPGLIIDERELERKGVSYSVDTLRSLRLEDGEVPLCMVMGADAFLSFHNWKDWQEISSLAHLVVINRPGASINPGNEELADFYQNTYTENVKRLHQRPAGYTLVLQLPERHISSTFVRENIDKEKNVKKLLHEDVYCYIKREGLYHQH